MSRGLGWNPSLPDHRDWKYQASPDPAALPASVDLKPWCAPVEDQGELGSCTAFAIGGALEYLQNKEGLGHFTPSHLFIYWYERSREGTTGSDSGAMIRDGIYVVGHRGVYPEEYWPYDPAKYAEQPPTAWEEKVQKDVFKTYWSVGQSATGMKSCLAEGYPFVFGVSCYDSFLSDEVAQTGVVPMPDPSEQLQGGHAILAVGYDSAASRVTFRNSWSSGWGDQGYGTIPFEYLESRDLAGDFWTLRSTGETKSW
jgi:C1A family cysteine protease